MPKSKIRHVAVIDIGKTNAKLLVVDLQLGSETTVAKVANTVLESSPYPHFNEDLLYDFVIKGLGKAAATAEIHAISITTHGACAALTDANGKLILPVLDYEHVRPDELSANYDRLRPPFSETGSPRLPGGLNLGAQIYWLSKRFPDQFRNARHILMWPQYWAMKLTGIFASELTSLGCHTDLWDPWNARFSSLVDSQGWKPLFPGIRRADDVLGRLKPEIAALTGLDANTPVYCGIHDSNASLLPYLDGATETFAVMSTGTWMISLSVGGDGVELQAERDTLANVNARGEATPTARFMAGREFEQITDGKIVPPSESDRAQILERQIIALPSYNPKTGPFPGQQFAWQNGEPETVGQRTCAASYYCALMGAVCLELIGARGPVFVEGAFGGNRDFLDMLATACARPVIASGQTAGTGLGAALLAGPLMTKPQAARPVLPSENPAVAAYAKAWKQAVAARMPVKG